MGSKETLSQFDGPILKQIQDNSLSYPETNGYSTRKLRERYFADIMILCPGAIGRLRSLS